MKIALNTKRRSGLALIVAIILFVLFLVFVGTLVYLILKAISRIPPRPVTPDETAALVEAAVVAETAELQAAHPNEVVTVQAASFGWVSAFVPFGSNAVSYVTVERSTNLVDWEVVARNLPIGDTFIDTNLPPDRAFYRQWVGDYVPVPGDTNHAPGFYSVPAQ
jgi:Na+-transporting methylmalonyl-CoA/oxaloacetate decarboxylase gamma subunit